MIRGEREERRFLLRVAELLHAYGTPAYRLERVLQKVAGALGVQSSFLAAPTSILVSFGEAPDESTHLLRVEPGEVNLGKLVEFDEVMELVESGRLPPEEATARLDAVAAAPSRYPWPISALSWGVASAGAACFFGGGVVEVGLTLVLGAAIYFLARWLPRRPSAVGVFEPLAAFSAAFAALLTARLVLGVDDRLVTIGSLIVLVPGLTLTIGFTELATRHLVSGVARIAGAATIFLTILFGVALAWRLGDGLMTPEAGSAYAIQPLPSWTVWLAVAVAPLAFAVLLEARPAEIGVVWIASVLGYGAARFGADRLGADLGPFLGSLTVGIASNLYARSANRPALVPLTPGILFLVPGSLGFRSLTSFLERDSLAGMEWAFQTGMVAVSLVGGLLAANIVLPPRRVL